MYKYIIIFICIFLILFAILLIRKQKPSKIAIVSMVTKHPDFDFWLDYHINKLGIDHIFLRVEEADYYKEYISKYPGKISQHIIQKMK